MTKLNRTSKDGERGTHVGYHNEIALRLLNVRDYSSIQDAIDDAENNKISVHLGAGIYDVSDTIIVKPGVEIILDKNAVIRMTENKDAIRVMKSGCFRGGSIKCIFDGFDQAAIALYGSNRFGFYEPTRLSDITINGPGSGAGIKFLAEQGDKNENVFGVLSSNLSISKFRDAILLQSINAGLETYACVNGNNFQNINISDCYRSIALVCDGSIYKCQVDGNMFSNVQIQPSANSFRALYVDGRHNFFSNCYIWDWGINSVPNESYPAIEMSARSNQNLVFSAMRPSRVLDLGIENKINSTFQ